MANQFDIHIDPYWGTAAVRLDGRPIGQYSPLALIAQTPIEKWIRDLSRLLYQEVNGRYGLKVVCHPFLTLILHGIFSVEPGCLQFQCDAYRENYTSAQRLTWASEAAVALGCSLPIRKHLRIACDAAFRRALSGLEHVQLCSPGEPGAVVIVTSDTQVANSAATGGFTGVLCCVEEGAVSAVLKGSSILLRLPVGKLASTMEQALDLLERKRYLLECYSAMSGSIGTPNVPFQVSARVRMLVQDHPCAKLKLQARVETGTQIPYSVEEFPLSNLYLQPVDTAVAICSGSRYYAGRVGTTRMRLLSAQGILLDEQPLEVYHVVRVASVTLDLGGQTMFLQGMQINIRAVFRPSNAQNTLLAVWSVSDPKVLKVLGNGRFLAVGYGVCKVTVTVEGVSGSVELDIRRQASDISLPAAVRIKVTSSGVQIKSQLLPANAACGRVEGRILDPSVARWDSQSKTILPVSEGCTELEVCLYDAAGQQVKSRRCSVEILPQKTVSNPNPSAVIALLLLFLFLSSYDAVLRTVCTDGLLLCACWMGWECLFRVPRHRCGERWFLAWMIALSLAVALAWLL